tara:strand:+ start:182 stop:454 length:273 start_codon:yes stop_codon:yes gene_type:complete
MNLDEIKNRLASLNNKGGGGKKSDYAANFWKPKEGTKSQVRIVPYKHNKDFPFSELYFYFGIGKPFYQIPKNVHLYLLHHVHKQGQKYEV